MPKNGWELGVDDRKVKHTACGLWTFNSEASMEAHKCPQVEGNSVKVSRNLSEARSKGVFSGRASAKTSAGAKAMANKKLADTSAEAVEPVKEIVLRAYVNGKEAGSTTMTATAKGVDKHGRQTLVGHLGFGLGYINALAFVGKKTKGK